MKTRLLPFLYCFCILLPLLYGACTKLANTPELPPATHTGANTLGFKANGKIYVAKVTGMFNDGFTGLLYADSTTYIAVTSDAPGFRIAMSSKCNPTTLGTYPITNTPANQGATFDEYNTDSAHGGSITYTFYDGTILAGTFAFDAVDANGSVIHITEGRFDIKRR